MAKRRFGSSQEMMDDFRKGEEIVGTVEETEAAPVEGDAIGGFEPVPESKPLPEPEAPVKAKIRKAKLRFPGQVHVGSVTIGGGSATCLPDNFDASVLSNLVEIVEE